MIKSVIRWRVLAGLPALAALLWASAALAGQAVAGASNVDQRALLCAVGRIYGLDPDLLEAIATVESHGDARAHSGAGALGLMQLMPATALRFGVMDPLDPVDNALGAARFIDYLRGQQRQPGDEFDLPTILAAYNAGDGAVIRYGGVPPYPETRDYVRRVLWLYLLGRGHSTDGRGRRSATQDSRQGRDIGRRHASPQGDQGVLNQLLELKRLRAAANGDAGAR